MTNEDAHKLARERGVNRPLYAVVRFILLPFVKVFYRFGVTGRENVPAEGAAIVVPNHKSMLDPFFVGLATGRHVRFMAKSELFDGPAARIVSGLGAFPVRRGAADPDALETARLILREGGILALFPEGKRIRDPDALSTPRRGAGRLAIDERVPVIPSAISGTEKLTLGPLPRPRKVQVSFAPAIPPSDLEATPESASELIENQVWPEVERQFNLLRAKPGLIAAALTALGVGGGIAVRATTRKPPKRRVPAVKVKVPSAKLRSPVTRKRSGLKRKRGGPALQSPVKRKRRGPFGR
jgi:1-acyl-sn-glycerol-3-phosphate acyltransferase